MNSKNFQRTQPLNVLATHASASNIHDYGFSLAGVAGALALGLSCTFAHAGGTTDGTVGAVKTLSGNFTVPQTLGSLRGNNLFHSFQSFTIDAGESATFTTDASIQNIITRVTGGNATSINGLLKVDAAGGNPNFFLINPAGVTFGSGAVVDVPGALHISTANALKFSDGAFYADASKTSTLSAAAPVAFGFLGPRTGAITVQTGANLSVTGNNSLSLSASDIDIQGANLSSQNGDIRLTAIGSTTGDVPLSGALPLANGNIKVRDGAVVATSSTGAQNGGNIAVSAGTLSLSNQDSSVLTAVSTTTSGTGNAGGITLNLSGATTIQNGASIYSNTVANGRAGDIALNTASLAIDGQGADTGIFSRANGTFAGGSVGSGDNHTTGASGNISVTSSGDINLRNGALISSSTFSSGNAGSVSIKGASMTVDGQDNLSGAFSQSNDVNNPNAGNAGNVNVNVSGALSLSNAAAISSNTLSLANAGSVTVRAGSINIDGAGHAGVSGIYSQSYGDPYNPTVGGRGGDVNVQSDGKISIVAGGQISASTFTNGAAGSVNVTSNSLQIDGQSLSDTGILSNAAGGSTGNAGSVNVTSIGQLAVTGYGQIGSTTLGSGNGGTVNVRAGSILLSNNGGLLADACDFHCPQNLAGQGGTLNINSSGSLSIQSGATISSSTWTAGKAGGINVNVGSITIDGDGSAIQAYTAGTGNAGGITVAASGNINLSNGGQITSDTNFYGTGGTVSIAAQSLTIDGKASTLGTGIFSKAGTQGQSNAGDVTLNLQGTLTLVNGGQVSTATDSQTSGSAGKITVRAGDILIDGAGSSATSSSDSTAAPKAGIFSTAYANEHDTYSSGNAGSVNVSATKSLSLTNGGGISSSSYFGGSAGTVKVQANDITLDHGASISSTASTDSNGQTGSVTVNAQNSITLTSGANLSIQNDASLNGSNRVPLQATAISLNAPSITLKDANINAASTGNIAASSININFSGRLNIDPSTITTSAVDGNGGSINIVGSGPLILDHSQITTSVTGTTNGNGGPINISVPVMVLNTGFVQANTAANASGGAISINVRSLLASGNQLFVAGAPLPFDVNRFGYNSIQASAPDGVNGVIQLSSPQIDLSGNLGTLLTPNLYLKELDTDLCRIGSGSSLTPVGHGGLPPSPTGLLVPGLHK